jgi:sterol 3beta-glucosyltransferase
MEDKIPLLRAGGSFEDYKSDDVVPASSSAPARLKIVLASVGSRGDVQPYIAVALALRTRGHNVAVATEERLRSLVEEFGLEYRHIYGDSCGCLALPEYQTKLANASGSIFKLMKITADWQKRFDKQKELASYQTALAGFDVIITGGLCITPSFCVAESTGAKWLPMILGPTWPTSEFPMWAMASFIPCKCLNRWSYTFGFSALWKQEKKVINAWRTSALQLPALELSNGIMDVIVKMSPPVIIACSTLICGPKRAVPADYPTNCHVGGFVFVTPSKDSEIAQPLLDFVGARNEKPLIYLGFGSMPAPYPMELLKMALNVCEVVKVRAVVIAGWSSFDDSALAWLESKKETLLLVKSAPHDWLFPKMSCIVHHCGVGTTAAALKSGVPQVGVPFMLDQFHNAKLLVDLGVSPGSTPFTKKLTADQLAHQVRRAITESSFAAQAKVFGSHVTAESANCLARYSSLVETWARS